jgi:hypothetical protein
MNCLMDVRRAIWGRRAMSRHRVLAAARQEEMHGKDES